MLLKPSSPRLQRGDPLARGLLLSLPFASRAWEEATMRRPVAAQSGMTGSASPGGFGAGLGGGAQYVSYAFDAEPPSQWSMEALIYLGSTANGSICGWNQSSDGSSATYDRQLSIQNGQFVVYLYDGGSAAAGVTIPAAGEIYHLIGVATGATLSLFVSGLNSNSIATGNGGYTGYSLPVYLVVGRSYSGLSAISGTVLLVNFWQIALTAAQVAERFAAPWRLFRPCAPVNGFFYAAGGASLVLAARGAALAKGLPAARSLAPLAARAAMIGPSTGSEARAATEYTAVLSAASAGMARARAGSAAMAALSARLGAAGWAIGAISTGSLLALAAIARGAGIARAAASYAAALAARGAAVGEGRAAPTAAMRLMARGGAAGSGQGSINFGIVALVAHSIGAACGRAGTAFASELQAASASVGSGYLTVSTIAALAARGRAGSAAAAILSAGTQLTVTARALIVGCARAALALAIPAPAIITNPTLEIVAASQRVPPGTKNVLTLTVAGPGISLTATDKGPLQG